MVTPKPRILVIDDEQSIRTTLETSLVSHGYEVMEASTGQNGIEAASTFHPHLIILDLGLPDLNGGEVLRRIRAWTRIPIIVLTVDDAEQTKVSLLDEGADDFLTKPFGLQELLARIRVALRHHDLQEATPTFNSGSLTVDLNQHTVTVSGRAIKLTTTEFELLAQLIRNRGKVVSQSQLLKAVWGPNSEDQGHYLRIYIGQLRKKLETNPTTPEHILTEPGLGYRIV